MSNRRVLIFKERADSASAKAREVAERAVAENRQMSSSERNIYETSMAELESCLGAVKAARADESQMASMVGAFAGIGGPVGAKDGGRRLSFKNMGAGIATRMLTGELGSKALAPSGATIAAQAFAPDPVALGRAATGLLDLLAVNVQTSSKYAYLRQSVRTNNAAVVAEGATKPTSVMTLARIEQSLSVIAHLSEGIPRYYLADNGALEQFVNAELVFGLERAVEAKVIADVNGTSGIQTQAWSTSIPQTLRKSLTKLEANGYSAGAIVLHPSDFETVELALSTTNAVERLGLPYDAAARRLFGVSIAVTTSATVGTGHVLATGAVELDTDSQGVQIMWSETSNADDFAKNLIRSRVEGRYGTSVLSPLGVVVATLTA